MITAAVSILFNIGFVLSVFARSETSGPGISAEQGEWKKAAEQGSARRLPRNSVGFAGIADAARLFSMATSSESIWQNAEAPSLADFERLAARAYQGLPTGFRKLCDQLVIRVAEFPEQDVLKELSIDSEFGLLGLFSGIGLPQGPAVAESGSLPNVIYLYRRPILDYWA